MAKIADRLATDEQDPLVEIDRRIDQNPELSEEEKALIKQKAREHVLRVQEERAEAQRKKLVDSFTERAIRDAEKVAGLHGAFVDITLDLAPHQPYLMIDGTMYFHGVIYEVTQNQAASMIEMQYRGWEHDNEIHGRRRRADLARRPANTRLSPHGVVNQTSMPAV